MTRTEEVEKENPAFKNYNCQDAVQNARELSRGKKPLIKRRQVVLGCPAVPKKPLRVLGEERWENQGQNRLIL